MNLFKKYIELDAKYPDKLIFIEVGGGWISHSNEVEDMALFIEKEVLYDEDRKILA